MFRQRTILFIMVFTLCFSLLSCQDQTNILPPNGEEKYPSGNLHYNSFIVSDAEFYYYTDSIGWLASKNKENGKVTALAEYEAANLALYGDILFHTRTTSGGLLNKISTRGTNQVRIGNYTLKYIIVYQDYIYAIDTSSGNAVKLRTDGSGSSEVIREDATALYLHGKHIFISGSESTGGITSFNLDTNETTQIVYTQASSLNVTEDWLYYNDPASHNKIYSYSQETSKNRQISDFSLEKPFIIYSGYLYGIVPERQNTLNRWPVKGSADLKLESAELVIDDAVDLFVIIDNRIFYRRPGSTRIYVQEIGKYSSARFS